MRVNDGASRLGRVISRDMIYCDQGSSCDNLPLALQEFIMFVRIAELSRIIKNFILLFCDVILLPLALSSAIALRLDAINPRVSLLWWLFLLFHFSIRAGLYQAVNRFRDDGIIA